MRHVTMAAHPVHGRRLSEERSRELVSEITRAHKQALGASVLMSEFLANMSHEVRTPLNGVLGLAALLLDTKLEAEQRQFAEGIRESAEALLTIVNDVLDLSKIEADQLVIEQIPFDLRATIAQAIGPFEVRAAGKGLSLEVRMSESVPGRVIGDPVRFRQVLVNLVDNAVKFTARGHIRVTVDGGAVAAADARIRVAVADSGIGIPRHAQAVVFEKFKQADSSMTRRYGGTGLGLAICKQLVGLMGGEIGVDSKEEVGSTFWFTLPLRADDTAVAASETPTFATGAALMRVLLAEDNVTNQTVARLFLEKLSCTVEVAVNGADAVAAARRSRFDVIFMDCQMPVLDGYRATHQIRERSLCTDVPIVAMTAHAMEGDRERCLAAGMTDYVSKPLKRELLASALARVRAGATPPAAAAAASVETITTPVEEPVLDAVGTFCALDCSVPAVLSLIDSLTVELPNHAAEIRRALDAGDWTGVRRAAHVITGAASRVSGAAVCGSAQHIDHLLQNAQVAEAVAHVPVLLERIEHLVSSLKIWGRTLREERHGQGAPA